MFNYRYAFKANRVGFGLWHAICLALIEFILKPRWIANEDEELGLSIRGIQFYYYKWSNPSVRFNSTYRIAEKREFGEVINSKLSFIDMGDNLSDEQPLQLNSFTKKEI